MAPKKTLYELLELQPDALPEDIRSAHDRLTQALEARHTALGHEEFSRQARLLRVAFSTLNNPDSRAAYDAELAARRPDPAPVAGAALALVPQAGAAPAADLRTDAMLLRAEAIALRANALELKAQAIDRGVVVAPPLMPSLDGSGGERTGWMGWVNQSMRRILLALGTFVAVGMVLQMVHVYTSTRVGAGNAEARRKAEERVFLDEYYQSYGVRPSSMAEARQLDEQRRREQEAKRQQQQAEREKTYQEVSQQRFEQDAQLRAEQVTRNLQHAEEQARLAREEEERRKRAEQRAREEMERRRIENQQAEWRRTLERN